MTTRFSGITLGLDIGSNSVGSAWIDTEAQTITLGDSVFPSGVEESDDKRGSPKNHARRSYRSQRRGTYRRANLKYQLRNCLAEHSLMPLGNQKLKQWIEMNPWKFRCKGLYDELTPFEFGRILLHLCQRRGAYGISVEPEYKEVVATSCGFVKAIFLEIDQTVENKVPLFLIAKNDQTVSDEQVEIARNGKSPKGMKLVKASGFPKRSGRVFHIEVMEGDYVEAEQVLCEIKFEKSDSDEGKIKNAINKALQEMERQQSQTFGEMMYKLRAERSFTVGKDSHKKELYYPTRNRKNALGETVYEFCADRQMVLDEFIKLWRKQKEFDGKLSKKLTPQLYKVLFNDVGDKTWRQKGLIFGQRNFYWDIGTLGRCDLEPTDQLCPKPDMYAQEFLTLETLNNIRIAPPREVSRQLNDQERAKVLELLQTRKNVTAKTVRRVLSLDKGVSKTLYTLSLDTDPNRKLNTNWFYREIILGIWGESKWKKLAEDQKDSINKAILKFDPAKEVHADKLYAGCQKWWGLSTEQAKKFIQIWKNRPKRDERINLSRKAVKNLLKYMRTEKCSVTEARQHFVEDAGNGVDEDQRQRYALVSRKSTKATRNFLKKHPDLLPPVSYSLSNPVVRKAIHEVRRHIQAYLRRFGRKPDRVVVELAREAKQTAKARNEQLARNRKREDERKKIISDYNLKDLTKNQRESAIKRVLLCREQRETSAYSNSTIIESMAADGTELEIDHIVPKSKGGPNALINRVLCFKHENLKKGNKTIKEWLSQEEFGRLEQRLGHLKKDNPSKWEFLHKEVKDLEAFSNSQLTDTAYASLQVSEWLRDALYDGELDGKRRVFATKGSYTALLRKDWQLFPDKDNGQAEMVKKRSDHRHHALDAVAIAMSGPECLQRLSNAFKEIELAKENSPSGYQPKREPIMPPWGTAESFRHDVISEYDSLVVAHRPVNRKIVGEFHKVNSLGAVIEEDKDGNAVISEDFCTKRIYLGELSLNHLRVPENWDELYLKMRNSSTKAGKKAIRSEMLKIPDVKPGKSGIVRDRWFRQELRVCLQQHGFTLHELNEEGETAKKKFSKKLKDTLKNSEICLISGVPIRHVTLLMADTKISITRKQWNPITKKMEDDPNLKSVRLYQPQGNHHIEIREDFKGKWIGEVVRTFDTARRNAERLRMLKKAGVPSIKKNRGTSKESRREFAVVTKKINNEYPIVIRKENEVGKFIMSLSIGEMVKILHPKTKEEGYFVVFKIDGTGSIHLTPHYDAGRSKKTEKCSQREDISLSAVQLQKLNPSKIWVGPIADDYKILEND